MTIKEVEQLTGLTAKSIRYYEEKNLLRVERNQDNAYRMYSEENVTTLKWIKLFRYLGFNIEEIETLLTLDAAQVRARLQEKAEHLESEIEGCEARKDLCLALSKDYQKGPSVAAEYEDAVQFFESEEMSSFREELKNFTTPSLSHVIIQTLIFMGPVFSLFINIARGQEGALMLNGVLAIVATVILTFIWANYFREYRRNPHRVREKNKKMALILPFMVVAIFAMLAAVVLIFGSAEGLMAPEDWLFYQHATWAEPLLILLILFPVFLGLLWAAKKLRLRTDAIEDNLWFPEVFAQHKLAVSVIWLLLFYLCFTSITFVTADEIICHSPLHPAGVSYSYEDVEHVEAAFGSSNFAFLEHKRKGQFSYTIDLDENSVTFSVPSVNEDIQRYTEHTYLELEEFDQALMALGVPKTSNETHADACDLDQEYVDRFLRIIRNTPN